MHTKSVLSLAAVTLAVGLAAGPAQARPYCGDVDPCPTPTTNAGAGTATGTVSVNKGYTLAVRARPKSGARVVRRLGNGTRVKIVCQTTGDAVTGRFGTSTTWDKLAKGGFVSDAFVYTGTDGRVAKDCGSNAPAPAPAPTPAPSGRPASVTFTDDYPYKNGDPDKADKWGFFQRECTSFVAWRLNRVKPFSNFMKGGHFGNAMGWDDNARRIGMKVDRKPAVGAVMVRNSGTYGHVAIVAKVGKGKIYVEQYNAGGTHRYSQEWLTVTSVMSFIHA